MPNEVASMPNEVPRTRTYPPARRQRTRVRFLALAVGLTVTPVLGAQRPVGAAASAMPDSQAITIDDALGAARAANAALPVAAFNVDVARTVVREIRASRRPSLATSADVNLGGPLAYTTSQGWLQVVASDTLFAGGRRRASLAAADYRTAAAAAGYRVTAKDVDLAVRVQFSALQATHDEVAFRERGIARLQSYLAEIRSRQAAGQPVGSDVLRTEVRLGADQANLADAQRRSDDARLLLNQLMGRSPAAPLAIVPLAAPVPPPAAADTAPWNLVPEVKQAAAERAAAESEINAAHAERRPQLSVAAGLGALPVFFSKTNAGTGPWGGAGPGATVMFSLSLPLWDGGGYRARVERAQILARQATAIEALTRGQSRLAWQRASAQLTRLYDEVQAWGRNVPVARDAYLQMASTYAGGAATTLEVLDAYSAWINASTSYTDAVLRYRQAEADYLRWGTP